MSRHVSSAETDNSRSASGNSSPLVRGWLLGVALGLVTWAAFAFDAPVDCWVRANATSRVTAVARAFSRYGDWPFLMGYGLAGVVVCKTLNRRQYLRIICLMMLSSSLSGVAVNAVRLTAGRSRPSADIEPGWYGPRYQGHWTAGMNKFHAFPSGHTGAALGFAVPLLLLVPEVGTPVLIMAVAVAGSRIYLRAHHLSDVTVAAAMAVLIAIALTRRWQAQDEKAP